MVREITPDAIGRIVQEAAERSKVYGTLGDPHKPVFIQTLANFVGTLGLETDPAVRNLSRHAPSDIVLTHVGRDRSYLGIVRDMANTFGLEGKRITPVMKAARATLDLSLATLANPNYEHVDDLLHHRYKQQSFRGGSIAVGRVRSTNEASPVTQRAQFVSRKIR